MTAALANSAFPISRPQLIENSCFQTMTASKAARVVSAAKGREHTRRVFACGSRARYTLAMFTDNFQLKT